jgi:hypothetical protein
MKNMVLVMIITISVIFAMPYAFAQVDTRSKFFNAQLTGEAEVPARDTIAGGIAKFQLNEDQTVGFYRIELKNIEAVTAAHIHLGQAGENGPIVLVLFRSQSPTGSVDGVLSEGDIISEDFEGPLEGKTISDLIHVFEEEGAYVNILTEENPSGEIRGQIG